MSEVHLTYYKSSGKYYSEGRYVSEKKHFYEVVDEIRDMLNTGKRPGLVDGFEFHVVAEIYDNQGPMSHLFIR